MPVPCELSPSRHRSPETNLGHGRRSRASVELSVSKIRTIIAILGSAWCSCASCPTHPAQCTRPRCASTRYHISSVARRRVLATLYKRPSPGIATSGLQWQMRRSQRAGELRDCQLINIGEFYAEQTSISGHESYQGLREWWGGLPARRTLPRLRPDLQAYRIRPITSVMRRG